MKKLCMNFCVIWVKNIIVETDKKTKIDFGKVRKTEAQNPE